MSGVAPNQLVVVYHFGDNFKLASKRDPLPYADAVQAIADGRGRWWNRKDRKMILFPIPEPSSEVRLGSVECNKAFIEKYGRESSKVSGVADPECEAA